MFATFDTPFEVTTSELAIELLFPADAATTELLENLPTNPDELLALARELGGAQGPRSSELEAPAGIEP
jgi:hypothetical protein